MISLIIMQFLYRKNYKVTDKITKKRMKTFSMEKPEYYDKNKSYIHWNLLKKKL